MGYVKYTIDAIDTTTDTAATLEIWSSDEETPGAVAIEAQLDNGYEMVTVASGAVNELIRALNDRATVPQGETRVSAIDTWDDSGCAVQLSWDDSGVDIHLSLQGRSRTVAVDHSTADEVAAILFEALENAVG